MKSKIVDAYDSGMMTRKSARVYLKTADGCFVGSRRDYQPLFAKAGLCCSQRCSRSVGTGCSETAGAIVVVLVLLKNKGAPKTAIAAALAIALKDKGAL